MKVKFRKAKERDFCIFCGCYADFYAYNKRKRIAVCDTAKKITLRQDKQDLRDFAQNFENEDKIKKWLK